MYLRNKNKIQYGNDFYMVGGMGHASSVALGYSLFANKKTLCIDGDGSFLMHLGSLKTAATFANKNFKYILLNNNCHDSVGGQTTYANDINLKKLSLGLGFNNYFCMDNPSNLQKKIKNFLDEEGLNFLEVKISKNKIKNLPRPKDLIEIKKRFMK